VRNPVDPTTIAFALLNLFVQIAIVAAILRHSQQPPVIYCRRKKQVTLAAGLDVGQETGHQLVVVSAIVSLLSDRRYGSIFTYRGKIAVRFSTPPKHGALGHLLFSRFATFTVKARRFMAGHRWAFDARRPQETSGWKRNEQRRRINCRTQRSVAKARVIGCVGRPQVVHSGNYTAQEQAKLPAKRRPLCHLGSTFSQLHHRSRFH
jgi:hypothetical protein